MKRIDPGGRNDRRNTGRPGRPALRASPAALLFALLLAGGGLPACTPEQPAGHDTAAGAASHEAGHEQLWTCGMHPNVVEDAPGTCPICGMDLTPMRSGMGAKASGSPSRTSPGASSGASSGAAASDGGERTVAYWVAPMDPTFIADAPGKSPMGMDLVPVYEDEVETPGAALVSIDPVVVQNMGVRIERVKRQPLFRHLRTVGEVETAEDLVSVVNLRFSGWVEKIHVDTTGELIEAGQPLLEIYSPDLVSAQEEYLLARQTQGPKSSLARSARRKLSLLGLTDSDIDSIRDAGVAHRTLPIRAPRSGYVLQKNVAAGARVMAGQDLYRIADLSRVWVQAEVYEHDAPWVEVGQSAQMELGYQKGRLVDGSVAYVYPTLNEASRTLTVRLEFTNPDLRLKPGMFATVYIEFRRIDDALVVPTEAILHSGTRELVFVALGQGRFEPRRITTGLVGDRRLTQVLTGLEPGEQVVTSGQFLIDSESQLQEAIAKMLDRRSGHAPGDAETALPEGLFSCPMHPEQISSAPGRCEICGMDLEHRSATPEEMARLHARAANSDASQDAPAMPGATR